MFYPKNSVPDSISYSKLLEIMNNRRGFLAKKDCTYALKLIDDLLILNKRVNDQLERAQSQKIQTDG